MFRDGGGDPGLTGAAGVEEEEGSGGIGHPIILRKVALDICLRSFLHEHNLDLDDSCRIIDVRQPLDAVNNHGGSHLGVEAWRCGFRAPSRQNREIYYPSLKGS